MRNATNKRLGYARLRGLALALALGKGLPTSFAAAAEAGAIASLTGAWELSLHDTPRKCAMILRAESARPAGHMISMPAGCRRAMPVLVDVGGWMLAGDRRLVLDDRGGAAVLTFAPGQGNQLLATGPEGETYELSASAGQQFAQATTGGGGIQPAPRAAGPAVGAPVAPQQQAAGKTSQSAPRTAPPALTTSAAITRYPGKPSDLAGRYVILREGAEGGKDVGCMLTLDDRARGPGGSKAQLAPACRDNGIVVFDPLGWHFERGRLVLTARKGHNAAFDYHADGSWWKDPKEGGKPLGVRHM